MNGCWLRGSVFGLDSFNPGVEPAVPAYVMRPYRLLAMRAKRESRGFDLEMCSAFVTPGAGYSPLWESHYSSCEWSGGFFCLLCHLVSELFESFPSGIHGLLGALPKIFDGHCGITLHPDAPAFFRTKRLHGHRKQDLVENKRRKVDVARTHHQKPDLFPLPEDTCGRPTGPFPALRAGILRALSGAPARGSASIAV